MIMTLALAALLTGQAIEQAEPLDAATPALRGPAVVVLWASWCTTCRAELERLPLLAQAARPLAISTVAIDPPERARSLMVRRGMSTLRAYADRRDPRTVLDSWGGPGAALPVAVALDSHGQVCGRKLGLLGTDQLRAWAQRCR